MFQKVLMRSIVTLLPFIATAGVTTSLSVTNPGFDSPALGPTAKYFGWTSPNGLVNGGWNGSNYWGHHEDDGIVWGTPVDGSTNQVAFISSAGGGAGALWQETANTFRAGYTYVLSGDVAYQSNNAPAETNGLVMLLQHEDQTTEYIKAAPILRRGMFDDTILTLDCVYHCETGDEAVGHPLGECRK